MLKMDVVKVVEIVEILEELLEDMPSKPREELVIAINLLKSDNLNVDILLKVQDQLEFISNISNVDTYSRNEISNVLTELEELM